MGGDELYCQDITGHTFSKRVPVACSTVQRFSGIPPKFPAHWIGHGQGLSGPGGHIMLTLPALQLVQPCARLLFSCKKGAGHGAGEVAEVKFGDLLVERVPNGPGLGPAMLLHGRGIVVHGGQ